MAKTTRVVLTCDLHGDSTDAVTTLRLDNGTARYELDLCQTHLDELTGAGRRLRARRRTSGAGSATQRPNKTAAAKIPSPRPPSPGHRGSARMGACEWLYGQRSRSNPASDPGSLQRPRVDKFQTPNRRSGRERNPDFVRPWRVQPSIDRSSAASTSCAGAAELHGLIPPSGYPPFIPG